MSYRKCQWCEKDIYQEDKWVTVIWDTGLALYFCSPQCLRKWVEKFK